MRIGQLARKFNINQDEVILFLNKAQAELAPFHHNSKLSDDMEDLVIGQFSLSPNVVKEDSEKHDENIPVEADEKNLDISEIDHEKKTEADLQRELDPTLPLIKTSVIEKKEEKSEENSIDTDTLIQLLEADETSNDLNKITHIKASKKELSGLKVVGKIELPEPKSKLVDESEDQNKAPKPVTINPPKKQQLSDEKKDNTRQKIKNQKERYEAKQEKRRIEAEKKKRKTQNKARYERKMQKVQASQAKQKIPVEEIIADVNDQPQAFKPISIFDWFWKLFNL